MGVTGGLTINGVYAASKIDDYAVLGLLGTSNSLAYKVHEIERHLHSAGSWFGLAATPTATYKAARVGDADLSGPFRIDAGNLDWGAWVQILGSDDTPARASQTHFDPHEMAVADSENNAIYFVQFSRGASGDAGITAGTYTEFVIYADKTSGSITPMQTGRAPAGSLLWARCMAPGQNTSWLDFYFGVHEYQG